MSRVRAAAPRQGFACGKHQLKGIEIRTVGREKHEGGIRLCNVLRTGRVLVDGGGVSTPPLFGPQKKSTLGKSGT